MEYHRCDLHGQGSAGDEGEDWEADRERIGIEIDIGHLSQHCAKIPGTVWTFDRTQEGFWHRGLSRLSGYHQEDRQTRQLYD